MERSLLPSSSAGENLFTEEDPLVESVRLFGKMERPEQSPVEPAGPAKAEQAKEQRAETAKSPSSSQGKTVEKDQGETKEEQKEGAKIKEEAKEDQASGDSSPGHRVVSIRKSSRADAGSRAEANAKSKVNSAIYSLKEDFFIFEKMLEYQNLLKTYHNLRKVEFYSPLEDFLGRTYSSISKRVERIQNVPALIKLVVFFFAKKFPGSAGSRKVIMPQGKDIIIASKEEGSLPPAEQQYFESLREGFIAQTPEFLDEVFQELEEIKARQASRGPEDEFLFAKFFAQEVEEILELLRNPAASEEPEDSSDSEPPSGSQSPSQSESQKEESEASRKKAKQSKPSKRNGDSASLFSEDKSSESEPEESEHSHKNRPKKKRSNTKEIRKPSLHQLPSLLQQELTSSERNFFELLIEKTCAKFGVTREEVLNMLISSGP